ncbi:MAG: hypothetical protein IFNCLDLE_00881 [Ignavibacteriaceae bacterium]|nr:hypothetical protein [Ignavibacteriaceae bacterium]
MPYRFLACFRINRDFNLPVLSFLVTIIINLWNNLSAGCSLPDEKGLLMVGEKKGLLMVGEKKGLLMVGEKKGCLWWV